MEDALLRLVGVPGLEPGKAGPESAVLPLHHTPMSGHPFCSNAGAKVLLFFEPPSFFAVFFAFYPKKNSKSCIFCRFFREIGVPLCQIRTNHLIRITELFNQW